MRARGGRGPASLANHKPRRAAQPRPPVLPFYKAHDGLHSKFSLNAIAADCCTAQPKRKLGRVFFHPEYHPPPITKRAKAKKNLAG